MVVVLVIAIVVAITQDLHTVVSGSIRERISNAFEAFRGQRLDNRLELVGLSFECVI